jgi:hypothetical protein
VRQQQTWPLVEPEVEDPAKPRARAACLGGRRRRCWQEKVGQQWPQAERRRLPRLQRGVEQERRRRCQQKEAGQ